MDTTGESLGSPPNIQQSYLPFIENFSGSVHDSPPHLQSSSTPVSNSFCLQLEYDDLETEQLFYSSPSLPSPAIAYEISNPEASFVFPEPPPSIQFEDEPSQGRAQRSSKRKKCSAVIFDPSPPPPKRRALSGPSADRPICKSTAKPSGRVTSSRQPIRKDQSDRSPSVLQPAVESGTNVADTSLLTIAGLVTSSMVMTESNNCQLPDFDISNVPVADLLDMDHQDVSSEQTYIISSVSNANNRKSRSPTRNSQSYGKRSRRVPSSPPRSLTALPSGSFCHVADAGDIPMETYNSDGERFTVCGEPVEITMAFSCFEPPTTNDFQIIIGGSQKGGDMLVNGRGHRFCKHSDTEETRIWRCPCRGGINFPRCNAKVIQKKGQEDFLRVYEQEDFVFFPHDSVQDHTDLPKYGIEKRVVISKQLKERAMKNKRCEPGILVNEVLQLFKDIPAVLLPNVASEKRKVINHRAKTLPKEPSSNDPFFTVPPAYFNPAFYRGAFTAGAPNDVAQHHLFATPEQLHHLKMCKRWYVDATFFLPKKPIVQLFTINGFLKNDKSEIKQFPLAFMLMTRRRAVDYAACFKKVEDIIAAAVPGSGGLKVEEIVSDFERAIFSAVKRVFPSVKHFGCAFHWAQAIMKKVRDLGLGPLYSHHESTKSIVKNLMALCYIPAEKIKDVFTFLKSQVSTNHPKLLPLFEYMDRNWINGKMWKPENWTVFNKAVRTNNDCEGLHAAWNSAAGRKMSFYKLAEFLENLATNVTLEARLLCHSKIKRNIKKSSKSKQKVLFDLWERYQKNGLTSLALLHEIVEEMKVFFQKPISRLNDTVYACDLNDAYDMDLIEP